MEETSAPEKYLGDEQKESYPTKVKHDCFTDPRFFADHPWHEYLFIFSACLGQILTLAGANYTLTILKVLEEYYDSPTAERSWYMSSFALTCGTFILASGRLGDVYGPKPVILIGHVFAFIWAILGAVSYWVQNETFFICCRALQGVGVAMILPNVLGAAGRVYKAGKLRKHLIFALIGWCAPIGGIMAPFFGGLIAVKTKYWNWLLWAYAIATLLGFFLVWLSFPHFPSKRKEVSVDWIGCGLAVSGMLLLNFVWNQAPLASNGWKNPYIIVLLIVSIALLAIFVWYELRYPSNPLLPSGVLKNFRILIVLICLFLCWGSFGILIYHYFVFNLWLRDYSPLGVGAAAIPAVCFGLLAAMSCPFAIRLIPIEIVMTFSMAAFLGGMIMLAVVEPQQGYWHLTFAMPTMMAFGMDWSFPASSILLSDELPHEIQGMAGSLIMTMINYGLSFFVGVSGTIETQIGLHNGDDLLGEIRACAYYAIGLAGASTLISAVFGLYHFLRHKPRENSDMEVGFENEDLDDGVQELPSRTRTRASDSMSRNEF